MGTKCFMGFAIAALLAGCASAGAPPISPSSNVPESRYAAACTPNFTLALSPASATISSGQTVRVTAGLTSTCGLAGTIDVGIVNISPAPHSNGPTIAQCCYDIPLRANGTAGTTITFGASSATRRTTYSVRMRAEDVTGGCCYGLSHFATLSLTVK